MTDNNLVLFSQLVFIVMKVAYYCVLRSVFLYFCAGHIDVIVGTHRCSLALLRYIILHSVFV
jgi:hypothetical protein